MLSLEALGIRANQITVYHRRDTRNTAWSNCICRTVPTIIDPVYAVYYVDSTGTPVGLDALQAGAEIHYRQVQGARNPGYPDDP